MSLAPVQKEPDSTTQDLKNFIRKLPKRSLWLCGYILAGVFLLSSALSYAIGNIFFGDVPRLYNVTLAQFFFERSTEPIVGEGVPYAHYQLSRTYFIQGNFQSALDEAYKELEIYPEHRRTYYILGLTYGYMDEEEKAIEAFKKFIEWKPESWAARNDCAWLQFRIGDIDGALETIGPVTKQTRNPWVQNTYAVLLMNKDRFDEAKQALLYAKETAFSMTEESWGMAYPGNDPRIYGVGLEGMKISIEENLKLLGG